VRPNPHTDVRVRGLTGDFVLPPMIGTLGIFGEVYVMPDSNANILSMGKIEEDFQIIHGKDSKTVVSADGDFVFEKSNRLYLCDYSKHKLEAENALVSTVSDMESQYTQQQIQGAQRSALIEERLGHPARNTWEGAIRSGVFIENPVTTSDSARKVRIYGTEATLKGKSRTPPPTSMAEHDIAVDNSSEQVPQALHIDTFKAFGVFYLLCFAVPLGALSVECLSDKSEATITRSLTKIHRTLTTYGFPPTELHCDGEVALSNAAVTLGLRCDVVPPGRHNPLIERQIEYVKNSMRSQLAGLKKKGVILPRQLLRYLPMFTVSRLNMFPSNSAYVTNPQQSAREKLLGRKTNLKIDVGFAFGDYCQARNNSL
jgi:hypothetical protein